MRHLLRRPFSTRHSEDSGWTVYSRPMGISFYKHRITKNVYRPFHATRALNNAISRQRVSSPLRALTLGAGQEEFRGHSAVRGNQNGLRGFKKEIPHGAMPRQDLSEKNIIKMSCI